MGVKRVQVSRARPAVIMLLSMVGTSTHLLPARRIGLSHGEPHVDYCGPNAAFARSSSNLWLQVWESDGDIYWLSWLIICPARRSGELFGGSGGLGEAVPDH